MSLLQDIRERRFAQFLAVYTAGAWGGLELADQLVSQGVFPDLWYRLALVFFIGGFPIAMVLGWYHGAKGSQGMKLREGWLLAMISLTMLATGAWVVRTYEPTDAAAVARRIRATPLDDLEAAQDPRRIAVLYFEPRSRQEEVPYLAAGLTEGLIDELSSISALSVVSRNGTSQFRGNPAPPDSIGRTLNVGTIVDGTVALSEDRIRVNVSFVNASTGDQFGRALVERPRAELFELQDDLVHEVAAFLRTMLGEELELIERLAGAENVEAWELMQRARVASEQAEALSDAGDVDAEWDLIGVADSLLAAAEEVAPEWVEPTVRRGWIAYKRSRWRGAMEQAEAAPWIDEGMAHAQVAILLQPDHADALELRGTLRYWRWLLDLEPEASAAEQLFAEAETDLRQAIAVNQDQAGAWAILSHLVANKGESAEAKMAALNAYQADAYLRDADVILWRLFSMSYDLEDQPEANYWCDELGRRFPDHARFVECLLWRMTMHDAETDVGRAWKLADALVLLSPPQEVELSRRWAGMAVAAVIAREGMADSARAVAFRSRGDASVDPTRDLMYVEIFVRTLLGDNDEAIDLLTEFVAATGADSSDIDFWWFSGLREEPRYQTLLGAGGG